MSQAPGDRKTQNDINGINTALKLSGERYSLQHCRARQRENPIYTPAGYSGCANTGSEQL